MLHVLSELFGIQDVVGPLHNSMHVAAFFELGVHVVTINYCEYFHLAVD